jgi:Arm domain-containing DNA-binding protein/integrase-like protein
MPALTERTVTTIKPGGVRREVADRLLPGLYLVVQPSGARSWAVRYRHHGRTRKHTLGTYPVIDLKAARGLARKALHRVAEGKDPGQEKHRAKADTVAALAEQFIDRHCNRENRPRTAEETKRLLDLHVLPRWRHRLAREITRRDVLDLLDALIDSGKPIAANRTLAAIRKMFNWAVARDTIPASPCAGVKPPTAERSRDRILTDVELRNVWLAADQLDNQFGALVKLLILLGQRRDECAGMRHSELNFDAKLWTLAAERAKNNKPHDIALADFVIGILTALPRIAGSDFVLTTTGDAPSNGYSKGKRKLDSLLSSDMPAWRLHDLRRTVASGMAKLGINLPVIEKVLNHASGSFAGIVGVYQRHDFADEKRIALQRWSDHVEQLVSGKAAKVVTLRGKRR